MSEKTTIYGDIGESIFRGSKTKKTNEIGYDITADTHIFKNPIGIDIQEDYNFGKIKITFRNSWRDKENRVIMNITGLETRETMPDQYRNGFPYCVSEKCDDRLLDGYDCLAVRASNGKWVCERNDGYEDYAVWYVNNSDDMSIDVALIFVEEIGKCVERLRNIRGELEKGE